MTSVLGLDLSLTMTGMASCIDGHFAVGRVPSKPVKTGDPHMSSLIRIKRIVHQIAYITSSGDSLPRYDVVAIEGPAYSAGTGSQHERAGLWWKVYERASEWTENILIVGPTQLKKYATGKGNAGKDEVMLAVSRRYPDAEILDNNQADAVCLAAIAYDWLTGTPIVKVPANHREALKKLRPRP